MILVHPTRKEVHGQDAGLPLSVLVSVCMNFLHCSRFFDSPCSIIGTHSAPVVVGSFTVSSLSFFCLRVCVIFLPCRIIRQLLLLTMSSSPLSHPFIPRILFPFCCTILPYCTCFRCFLRVLSFPFHFARVLVDYLISCSCSTDGIFLYCLPTDCSHEHRLCAYRTFPSLFHA